MRDLFEGIGRFFEDYLFYPLNELRDLELSSWWAANIINFLFVIVGLAAFFFWMKQLKKFNDSDEEDKDPTAHSFLG